MSGERNGGDGRSGATRSIASMVRIPTIADSDSDRSRPLIPIERGQGFQ